MISKVKKFVLEKWCALLTFFLSMISFGACHSSQNVVVDDNDFNPPPDTVYQNIKKPIKDPKTIICLYGVPPSKFEEVRKE